MKVKNKRCIRNLSFKQFKAAKTRNLIAVFAIALTTLLFTSLFTIALSINDGFQQSNFRQCGGWSHGTFKYLTEEQFNELKTDTLIKEWGLRRFVGMPTDVPFNKSHVEVGYSDAVQAHWMYCDPIQGQLPQEGTNEAATDTKVLELLGIEPELGAEFTMTFNVDGQETTQTFILSGWWEYDEAIVANHVLIPQSRAEAIYAETGLIPGQANDGMTGTWNMDVMFKNSLHIAKDVQQLLYNHGYQDESRTAGDNNYIATGVNWGYSSSQLADGMDAATVLAIVGVLLLIIFTGYLIIYNVFQISVANDIRFYGLLKTIGTTPRQLKKIIRQQAILLSLMGIPLGLLGGWFVGGALTPVIVARLNGIVNMVSTRPLIFTLSALFALLTVLISCRRPGKLAAKVSPVEAVRYTEGGNTKKKVKKTAGTVSLRTMAIANLGRSRGKTTITVISLSLAVVLLNLTVTFTSGFDMDKYLKNNVVSDFLLADASYFGTGSGQQFTLDTPLPQEVIDEVTAQGGITEGGKVYGETSAVQESVSEDYYRQANSSWYSKEELDDKIQWLPKTEDGLLLDRAQLYGMEPFALDQLKVLDGVLSKLYESGSRYIAAVYAEDDYGNPEMDSHWAKVGDTVTLRYVEEFEYYDPVTGDIYPDDADLDTVSSWAYRAKTYQDIDYTVAALVSVPSALSYRYYGSDEFVLNDQTFCNDTGTDVVMLYAFNTTAEQNAAMESFLSDYTTNVNPQFDYESKATYAAEFESFRSMFLLLGGALSFIVGLVGILNFFNAILTGIITRKREFAMLQSVGMTGKQLKTMLVYEGLFFALGAGFLSLILAIVLSPLAGTALGNMFWFFTYHFTVTPILLLLPVFAFLGTLVPLVIYRFVAKSTIVERLRETE
ncbi:MAG: ABC transporter permease [Blautia sp.]|nr:ABC transporter permease [Blautia sp.]MDY3997795.1 ABC transporter permease [Blautia sp.]